MSQPSACPSCRGPLAVVQLACTACGTEVTGHYTPCPICRLDETHRALFDAFLAARGNLKEVQRQLGVSYPTVRQRMDGLFAKLEEKPPRPDPLVVLKRLRDGEITVDQAEKLLRGD